jgi:hypothetical protein
VWRNIFLIRDFFPFRLVFAHIKYNFFSLFTWGLLTLIIAERLGTDFGVPFLFYSPEYLGEVSHWSFAILGFSVGGLTMAFNTYSYSKLGPRFPFLVVVSAPFFRFCLNNALIPLSYIVYYLYRMSVFQSTEELVPTSKIVGFNFAYVGGFISFILLSFAYFFPIRKNKDLNDDVDDSTDSLIKSFTNKGEKWYNYFRSDSKRPIYYIGRKLKIYRSRSVAHLDNELIDQIYASGRINAFGFEAITLITFLTLGFFRLYPIFELPASVSIVLVFTILSMLFSAIFSWFHRWTLPIIFGTVGLMTYLSTVTPFFRYTSYALGLDYSTENRAPYTVENIALNGHMKGDSTNSHRNIKAILTAWKTKQNEKKPKLIILNTSGGGSRSALWTVVVLGNCDSLTNGAVSEHLHLISGASGGMVGAAYYREIQLRRTLGTLENGSNEEFKGRIAKDLLNKLSFSVSTSDLLMRYKKIEYNKRFYTLERGAAFEEHLHQNLNYFLEHPIGYYEKYERNAITPLMIFSPTIINDGRRLLISSQNLSFMVRLRGNTSTYENIDYQTFFKNNDPQSLRFSSAIRASATFPFIMPMMTMPTTPEIQLMDAGIRDNYGGKVTIDYLFANSEWIEKNTSGVIILETRDTKRVLNDEAYHEINLLDKITMPFGNIIINFTRTQDFDQEQLMRLVTKSFNFPVDIVTFNLREQTKDRVSLSWRLTQREKKRIEKAFSSQENTAALTKLKTLLGLYVD